MKVERTAIDGVIIIKPDMHGDARGFFVETWQRDRYADAGIAMPFVQDNHSRSSRGILRGMHFQREHPQGKLVHVSLGAIFDVVVDIRPHSPTFGQWTGVTLDAGQQHQLWIPPGMAHGFLALSDTVHLHYKCTDFYHPRDEGSLRWDDPDIGIAWPCTTPVLSAKDAAAPFRREVRQSLPARARGTVS